MSNEADNVGAKAQKARNMEAFFEAVKYTVVALAIVAVIAVAAWALVASKRSTDQKQVDIVTTCQEAADPEVCQALA